MNITQRQGAVFAAGLVLVALVLAVAWRVAGSSARPLAARPGTPALALPPPVTAAQKASACPVQPAVPAAGEKDGKFPLQPDLAGLTATEIGSFIVIGKESVTAGRPRDAEIAFLMACRLADKLKGTDSAESADAKYQLGEHYAKLTQENASGPAAGARAEWLGRAQRLYSDSLSAYLAKFGEGHEKSRSAAVALASVRQTLAQAQTAPLPEPSALATVDNASEAVSPAVVSRSPALPPRRVELARAAPLVRQTPSPLPPAGPSFDCTRARSIPEKMICSDAHLAQLDRELGRVYARARNATTDRAAFRRQQNQEWLRRESSCRDRDCLLRWYEERRDQLMSEIEGRRLSPATASR